jgi:hypothetical protein
MIVGVPEDRRSKGIQVVKEDGENIETVKMKITR